MKKELFFAFGPDDAYVFVSPSSYRQIGFDDVDAYSSNISKRLWVARSPQSQAFFTLLLPTNPLDGVKIAKDPTLVRHCPALQNWLLTRKFSPRRVVFGPEKANNKHSYVAWIPYGGHFCSPDAPQSVTELCASHDFWFKSIRLVALGVEETYVMIWENGEMRWNLKSHYNALDEILENFRDKGEEISHVALNASRAGDYFIYFDVQKLAMFQVSEAFGNDMEDVLRVEGIQSTAITRRRDTVARPILHTIVPPQRAHGYLDGIAKGLGISANVLSIGATIAGLAACNVM